MSGDLNGLFRCHLTDIVDRRNVEASGYPSREASHFGLWLVSRENDARQAGCEN